MDKFDLKSKHIDLRVLTLWTHISLHEDASLKNNKEINKNIINSNH